MIIQNQRNADDFAVASHKGSKVEVGPLLVTGNRPLLVTGNRPLLLTEAKFRQFIELIERKGYFTLCELSSENGGE